QDDIETTKYRLYDNDYSYRFNGKLDFALSNYINLTVGGNVGLFKFINWDYNSSLFDFKDGNEVYHQSTYRGFVRFTQRFPTTIGKEKSVFQNAYYSIQADYTKFYEKFEDPNIGFNAFDYV